MKLLPLLAAFLFATTTSRAPEPTTLQQLVEKAFTPPAPDATAPGRFLLHTSGGTLYRLDTATGGTWEMAAQLGPNGGTVNAWARVSESTLTTLRIMELLKPAK